MALCRVMVYKSDNTYTNSTTYGTLLNCMNFDEIFIHLQSVKSNAHKV